MNRNGARQVPNRSVISSPAGMPTIWANAWNPEIVPSAPATTAFVGDVVDQGRDRQRIGWTGEDTAH